MKRVFLTFGKWAWHNQVSSETSNFMTILLEATLASNMLNEVPYNMFHNIV